MNRKQNTNFVNESGLYQVIFKSNKPEAKKFKKWVTSEVLPEIRKTGQYSQNNNLIDINNKTQLGQLLIDTGNKILDLEKKIESDKPLVDGYNTFLGTKNCLTMKELSNVLYEITGLGRNKLFKFLRDKKILTNRNQPYQKYIDLDYFLVRRFNIVHTDYNENKSQTLVTPKGTDFIRKIVIKDFKNKGRVKCISAI